MIQEQRGGRLMPDQATSIETMPHPTTTEQFPGLSTELTNRYLPEHLSQQLTDILNLYKNYNEMLPEEKRRTKADFNYLDTFYRGFLADRNRRSEEIDTPEYRESAEKAQGLLPMATFLVLCMDGRVKPIHTNGFTAGVASAIRTPAGMLNEFIRSDGKLSLDLDTNFGKLLVEKLKNSENVAEVFDSHWTCAARIGEEAATGSHPGDSGLFSDVLTKKEMIKATKEALATSPDAEGKNVAFIQTTFNPYTGFMYMGLERDKSIEFAKQISRQNASEEGTDPGEEAKYAEYNKTVLKELIDSGNIISTGALCQDEVMQDALEQVRFDCDWQNNYAESAIKFWNAIERLKGEVGPYLEEKIGKLYPELTDRSDEHTKELQERMMLLLTNWFNASLHNTTHNENSYLETDDHEYSGERHYRYDTHMEEGVKVSEGGHPPYDIMMFVVYNGDLENLPDRIELASGIVRANRARKDNPVKDPTRPNLAPAKVERLPVPVVVQEIIRNEELVSVGDEDWKGLEAINWDNLPKNWNTMREGQFTDYLISKGIGNVLLRRGIEKMRRTMARIYEPQTKTAPHLKELFKLVLPIICDEERETHAIIPFVKVGRE